MKEHILKKYFIIVLKTKQKKFTQGKINRQKKMKIPERYTVDACTQLKKLKS